MNKILFVFDPNDNHDQLIRFSSLIQKQGEENRKIVISEISYIKLKKNSDNHAIARDNVNWMKNCSPEELDVIPRSARKGVSFLSECLERIGEGYHVFLFTATTAIQDIMRRKIPYQGSRLISMSLIKPTKNYEELTSRNGRTFYRVIEKPKIKTTTIFRTKNRTYGESYVYPIKSEVLINQAPKGWVII